VPPTEDWIHKAEEDMVMARLAVTNALWSPACFHAQQAAEKALKALFESVALPVPRTHDLVVLLNHLESARILDPQPPSPSFVPRARPVGPQVLARGTMGTYPSTRRGAGAGWNGRQGNVAWTRAG